MGKRNRGAIHPTRDALDRVTPRIATRYGVMPLRKDEDGAVILALNTPQAHDALGELRRVLGCPARAEAAAFQEAIRLPYGIGAETHAAYSGLKR